MTPVCRENEATLFYPRVGLCFSLNLSAYVHLLFHMVSRCWPSRCWDPAGVTPRPASSEWGLWGLADSMSHSKDMTGTQVQPMAAPRTAGPVSLVRSCSLRFCGNLSDATPRRKSWLPTALSPTAVSLTRRPGNPSLREVHVPAAENGLIRLGTTDVANELRFVEITCKPWERRPA